MSDRQRGRPRLFREPPVSVSVRIPVPLHDALSIEAVRRGVDLSAVIRERLDHFRISKIDTRDGSRHTT
jgi:hypothetical protein